jgi:moderate conductance mechanosensitive channel
VQATPAVQATPVANAAVSSAASLEQHWLYTRAVETGIALVVGFIVWRLAEAAIDQFFVRVLLPRHPRLSTYLSPLRSILRTAVLVVTSLVLLNIWNVDVGPAIWSAGAITAVLAFGAQWVVRDLLAGFSIFAENQFEVGDRIEIITGNNRAISGVVDSIGLRTTRLMDQAGRAVFIANGNIYAVTNLSRGGKRLSISLTLPLRKDVAAMQQEVLDVATAAVAVDDIEPDNVSVRLEAFDLKEATFVIGIRASHTQHSAEVGMLRARIVAGLQAKGWLPGQSAR